MHVAKVVTIEIGRLQDYRPLTLHGIPFSFVKEEVYMRKENVIKTNNCIALIYQ